MVDADGGGIAAFREKFRVDALTVHASEAWTWSVRPVQTTIGAGVLSANRDCEAFGDLTPDEGADLLRMIGVVEATLRAAFAYSRINYLMLMMVDPHVHFHVVPRYEDAVEFADLRWQDGAWPGPPNLMDHADQSGDAQLQAVRDHLIAHLVVDGSR